MPTREKEQRLEQKKKNDNYHNSNYSFGPQDLEDINNYYDKIIKERNNYESESDINNLTKQSEQGPVSKLNDYPENDKVIKPTLVENLPKYNSVIKTLSKNDLFLKVLDHLNSYDEYIVISEKRDLNSALVTGENGYFKHAEDGIIFPEGHLFNPHKIKLQVPHKKKPANGFTESTIFEELFHALQYISKDYYEKALQIETEAKVAKMFVLYDLAKSEGKKDEYSIAKYIHQKNHNSYERKFLLNFNGKKFDGQLNSIIKKYFEAIFNRTEVSEELEAQFRLEVKKLSDKVYDKYRDEWLKMGLKIDKNTYNGETPLFDELIELK
ncbi:hypothetical protein [Flammeovirga aprica]|uniref:Uncharacterized protein n=1 Tax=Flammeovirga aprica JL-4 TaxID=694437 RepID=A0A7X9RZF8_9BACT|nr:hypothetical protein [Flammeovirga aprica]NME71541.1 hypothetical protein [Flammeovirga aprica JL-4]